MIPKSHRSDLALAAECARRAGELLSAEFERGSTVNAEVGRDIKLAADVLAERAIIAGLRAGSAHAVLSEEAGADEALVSSEYQWIIDPLDGTFNFSRRLPWCCVSIGLWRGEQPVLGVVHDFNAGLTYTGVVGEGAWCNGAPMRVSEIADPSRAALCTGFPVGSGFGDAELLGFVRQVQAFKKLRLVGSAALSLALVAAGRVEAYQEDDINLWDVAAGLAVVLAAGGRIEVLPGRSRWQRKVFAGNRVITRPGTQKVLNP